MAASSPSRETEPWEADLVMLWYGLTALIGLLYAWLYIHFDSPPEITPWEFETNPLILRQR